MLEVIEKLLILQDRDRKLIRVQTEIDNVGPEKESHQARLAAAQKQLDAVKQKLKVIDADRGKLELEVETKKQQIEKYSHQQFQTKKNEEYQALDKEIQSCRKQIRELDDQQIELMEQAETVQKEIAAATREFEEVKATVEGQIDGLSTRELALRKELSDLQANYDQLTVGIDESALARYQRLRINKGANVVVGIDHGVCGGCHMKLPIQIVFACKAQQEIVACPNCGRMLYYTPHMEMAGNG